MSSFTNMLLIVFMIQLSLVTLGIADIPGDVLYTFITNPTSWDASLLTALVSDALLAIGGSLAFIGLFIFKSDFIVFAGLTATLFSFGKGLANLYLIMSAQVGGTFANFTIAPIILIFFMTLLGFWRGRSG